MNTKGIKFLAVLAVLALAFTFISFTSDVNLASAEETANEAIIVDTEVEYATVEAAFTAATTGQTVKVLIDSEIDAITIEDGRSIILDLNDCDLTSLVTTTFKVTNGSLEVTDTGEEGSGSISVSGEAFRVVGQDADSTLTLGAIEVVSTGDCCIFFKGPTSGTDAAVTIDCSGTTLTSEGEYATVQGNGTCGNETLTFDGCTITSTASGAIYVPNNGLTTLTNCTVSGVSSAIEIRAGTLNVVGGSYKATATDYSVVPNGNGTTTTGAAIAIAQHTTQLDITVSIEDDAELTGVCAVSLANPQNNTGSQTLTLTLGDVTCDGNVVFGDARFTVALAGAFVADEIGLTENGEIAIESGASITGKVIYNGGEEEDDSGSSVILTNVTAGTNGLTIAAGSVEISGEMTADELGAEIEAAGGNVILKDVTVTSGIIEIAGEIQIGEGGLTISEGAEVYVDDGALLTIDENVIVTVSGVLSVIGNVTGGTIHNEGTIYADDDAIESEIEGDDPVPLEDMNVKLTKLAGVEYYLNGELVSGTVKVDFGDLLTIKILFGYKATTTFAVLFDGKVQTPTLDGTYEITDGLRTVKVTGVEEIEFNEATITGKKKDIYCGAEDRLTVDGTLTLVEGAEVVILGELYVPAGATLVIEQNASLEIYGLLLIEGNLVINEAEEDTETESHTAGYLFIAPAQGEANADGFILAQPEMILSGTADIAGELEVAGVLTIESDMSVSETGFLEIDLLTSEVVVGKDAILTIGGSLFTGMPIDVKGTIVFNTEDVRAFVDTEEDVDNVINIESGATVSVVKYGACNGSTLSIIDKDANEVDFVIIAGQDPKADPQIEYDGKIVGVISGLTVTDSAKTTKTSTSYTIDAEGTLAVTSYYKSVGSEDEPLTVASAIVEIDGTKAATVTDSLVLSKNVSLAVAGKLTVSGTVDLTADKSTNALVNLGTITMSGDGIVTVYKKMVTEGSFNAVRYTVDTTATDEVYVYTTIDKALEQMNSDGNTVKAFKVMGEQTVTKSSKIPADISVDASGAKLIIGKAGTTDVVLNVDASDKTGLIKGTNDTQVIVNGTLYAAKKTNLNEAFRSKIVSDVISMELNEKGQEVSKGWQKWTNIYSALIDAQIGDVIELSNDVNATKDLTIPAGVEVDTQGHTITMAEMKKLTIDGELCLQEATSKVILKGEDDKKATMEVNGVLSATDDDKLYVTYGLAGAYYSVTEDDGIKYYCMSPVAVVAPVAALVDDAVIDVLGDKLVIGSITLAGVLETEYSDAIIPVMNIYVSEFTAGTITLDDAKLNIILGTFNGTVANEYGKVDLKVTSLAATASAVTDKDGEQALTLSGAVTYFDLVKEVIDVETNGAVVLKDFVAPEATLDGVVGIDGTVTIDYLYVPGTVAVYNEAKLNVDTAVIFGSLVAAEKTETKSAAEITADIIYLGVTPLDVFKPVTANDAVLSGKVILNDYLLCDPKAELPTYFADEDYYKSTVFYVDNKEYLIAIVPVSVTASADIGDVAASTENAQFVGWFDGLLPVDDVAFGDVDEAYAVFKYDIYDVMIVTDAGIKSVAINGIQMLAETDNTFSMESLKAGIYKVTYTLKSGYEGSAVLSTYTGTILKDNSFTLAGTEETSYVFQLAGTEPIPEPEPVTPEEQSEWTITTILLVILVILIAIMAVIVALRLNRS